MGITDYMEEGDVAFLQKAKDAFVDYVVFLEDTLDTADAKGKHGDIAMLEMLAELNDSEKELAHYAHRANEPIPMRNYHVEVTKLICKYLPIILAKEISAVEESLAQHQDNADAEAHRLVQLEHIIQFYSELYPEIPLAQFSEKINAIEKGFTKEAA